MSIGICENVFSSVTSVEFSILVYVFGRTPFSSSFSASTAFIASLIALPMFSPSGRFKQF